MQGESRWPKWSGSETRNSPIDTGLEDQATEDQEAQVYLGLVLIPSFQFPKIRHLPKSRHPTRASNLFFSIRCIWPFDCLSNYVRDREIRIHSIHLKWAYGGGASHRAEEASLPLSVDLMRAAATRFEDPEQRLCQT